MARTTPRTLSSVERTLDIIDVLIKRESAGVSELADELGISNGGAYNHLATLKKYNYVTKHNGEYRLSLRFLNVGNNVKHKHELYICGEKHLKDLADETEEYAHLMTILGGKAVYLSRARGDEGMAEEFHEQKTETTDHLHYTSTGKAILSRLPDEKVDRIIENHGLPAHTNNTITERGELLEELEKISEQGYAVADEEEVPGTRAIGAPIEHERSNTIGAISVSGPKSRFQGQRFTERLPKLVQDKANLIEIKLNTTLSP